MEKQASIKSPTPPGPSPANQLSPQDWETLIDDFQSGVSSRRARWIHLPIESSDLLFRASLSSSLSPMIDSLRSLLLSSTDPALKEQVMISTTSIAISVVDSVAPEFLDPLTELLLGRQPPEPWRGSAHACSSLSASGSSSSLIHFSSPRPQAISGRSPKRSALMLHNRTSSSLPPSFARLLATAFSPPLLPFSLRPFLLSLSMPPRTCFSPAVHLNYPISTFASWSRPGQHCWCTRAPHACCGRAPEGAVLWPALLLRPHPLPCSSYAVFPLLRCVYRDDELGIARRLALIPKEAHQPMFIRLLAIHWLLGSSQLSGKQGFFPSLMHCFYPTVFDPLSLKASKLDVLSSFAAYLDDTPIERDLSSQEGQKKDGDDTVAKFFEEGLVCLSAFKWLSPSSSETTLFFRTLHKFLIEFPLTMIVLNMQSILMWFLFFYLQNVAELALAHCKLVPMIVSFIDRLFECKTHQLVGEHLFQTLNEQLLPKLEIGYLLVSYFPLFERIASNDSIPPRGLVELLLKHVVYLTEKHGPETSLSSRIFLTLSQLLGFTCQFFPDLEDLPEDAVVYPRKKLKTIMDFDGQLTGMSPSPHPASLFQVLSPMQFQDPKKLSSISSYIHLERAIPPLVKQSWSLVLPNFEINENKTTYFEGTETLPFPPRR
ncbi:hypothetical protein HPP92_012844 [Vanilla planifolia]|uniref:AP5B1 middle domain-containing protein n=1 Tax=Vanilla planifolia TaxID=51239 RepID=A0A835UW29_VANPL|nr:hypothetical protein HPP92_012844 [Vanilla planifolia]